jgi:plasmid stabilization system protein ParE
MYKLSISELADEDIDSIICYIAEQLSAPRAASDLLDEIEKCYTHLRNNPTIYEHCRNARLKKEGYRRAVVKNYLIFFKIDETKHKVVVHRVIHGTRDYAKLI